MLNNKSVVARLEQSWRRSRFGGADAYGEPETWLTNLTSPRSRNVRRVICGRPNMFS